MVKLSEAFELYRQDRIVFGNQSTKTEEQHMCAYKSLKTFLVTDIPIEELTFEHIRDWKISIDKRCCRETVRSYLIKIRVVLAYLQKRGYKVLDPDLIVLPKRIDKIPSFITKEQVATLIECSARIKNKAVISLLYSSGLRISELCSLDQDDLKEDSFTIIGKGGKARLCFVDDRTQGLIKAYLDTRTDHNPALFLTDAGHRLTAGTVQETFKSIRKVSGIPNVHPHTLRHTFCTELLKTNTNLRFVQLMMGHASLQTTQIYLHVTDPQLREVYKMHHSV